MARGPRCGFALTGQPRFDRVEPVRLTASDLRSPGGSRLDRRQVSGRDAAALLERRRREAVDIAERARGRSARRLRRR